MDNQNQTSPSAPSQLPPQNPSQNLLPQAEPVEPLTKTGKLKRSFFQILIGCLIGAASIAVIAVLLGKFNDVLGRALGTIGIVALHALLSFSYITQTEKQDKKDGGRSLELFNNTVFTLIAISFITAVFAIWQLLGAEITLKLYMFYGVILFATLHADALFRIRGFEKRIDTIVAANYAFMTAVVIMLSIVIFSGGSSDLGEFFYRLLAAIGIVDATMTITVIIMNKMYMQKHPKVAAQVEGAAAAKHKSLWSNPLIVLLLIFLGFQIVGSLIALFIRGF